MSVHKDGSGRRWVQSEVEVPGTPEEVWEAIASGPGLSSWFVPAAFETGSDGNPQRVIMHFGPGNSMDSVSEVTAWEPPHRFAATSDDWGPDAPSIATEWTVESQSGSTCTVRVVHSLFADTDAWDGQLEGTEQGWPWFFQILRLYVLHFRGQPCCAYRIMGATSATPEDAWRVFAGAVGLSDATPGTQCRSPEGMPLLVGTFKETSDRGHAHGVLVRLDEPAAGILSSFALPMAGQTYLVLDFFHYGKAATAAVEQWEPRWQAWMTAQFPMEGGG